MTTDELRIILRINGAATYTHTINEVTNVTNNYTNSIGNLTSTLAKLVSAGMIIKFGKQCIQAASDLQEVANVVDVTFGKNADLVNNWAKNNAASFGLSETSAKRYIGTYGTMAKQFDMTGDQAAAMAVELTKLTGDVASFYNMDDKAAAVKLKSVFTGETESLKELGVVMTETQLSAYALSKGIDTPFKKMSEHDKVLLRYQFTMEKLAHAQGDFARTSDGYANSMRGLNLNLENLKIEIGQQLLPVVAQGMQAVNTWVQAISPTLIGIAETIKYYGEAWKNASATTKTFVKISLAAIAVFVVYPKIVAIATAATKLLTLNITSLGMAIRWTLGILGIFLALLALADLTNSVSEMKNATSDIENLGESADTSTGAVDDLAESLDGLGESSKGLDTFLASFDEVNKVGGGGSLMSGLVTADDLNNILGASLGIENLQSQLDSLHMPSIIPEGIFTKQFWSDLGAGIMGFLEEVFFEPGEFWADWKRGFDIIVDSIENIGDWLDKVAPKWSNFWEKAGFNLYDASHDKDGKPKNITYAALDAILDDGMSNDKSGSFTAANGMTYAKYRNDGTLSTAYENYIRSGAASKTVNNTTTNNNTPVINTNVMIDGKKVASVVVDSINAMTRSSGASPLYG